jgi:hypothetical protein
MTLAELEFSRRRINKPGATIDDKLMSTETRNSADPFVTLAAKVHPVGVGHLDLNRFS